jgi:hypothetical protein
MELCWNPVTAAPETDNMRVARGLAAFLLGSSFLGLSLGAAQAITLTFGGGTVTSPPFPGYGQNVWQNNVVTTTSSHVSDYTNGSTYVGTLGIPPAAVNPAVATVGGVDALHGYKADWYFIGAESGYDVTLNVPGMTAPGLTSFTEHNQNNQCYSCGGLHGSLIGPQYLGTSTYSSSDTVLDFSLNAKYGATDKGTLANGPSNPAPGQPPVNGNMNASLVFSYAKLKVLNGVIQDPTATNEVITDGTSNTASSKKWKLISSSEYDSLGGIWFLFAFNDTGGPDDNHDDFVGMVRLYDYLLPPHINTNVPIPGAFLLMGTVLAGASGIGALRRGRGGSATA